jgi:hypothetical protein
MSEQPKGFFPVNPAEVNKTGDSKFLFLKEGVTQLRFLPPYSQRGSWFREVKEHNSRLNGEFTTGTCPRTKGKYCIFCEEGQRLYNLGGEDNVKRAKDFRPKQTFLFNVMVYSSPQNLDLTRGVLVLKSGVKVKRQLMDLDQDAAGGWGDITSLNTGFDIRITKKGKGQFDTEYFVKGVPSRNNLLDTLKKHSLPLDFAPHDLDSLLGIRPEGELKQMFDEFVKTPSFDNSSAPVKVAEVVGDEIPTSPVVSDNMIDVAPPTE